VRHINGVPSDVYGTWCQHGFHLLIADPDDGSDHPRTIPANPWPCSTCTLEALTENLEEEYRSHYDHGAYQ
jgi:hypothetical protein